MSKKVSIYEFLDRLNIEYHKLHNTYEKLFWISYMGDRSVDKQKDVALKKRDEFRANRSLADKCRELRKSANLAEKQRLDHWLLFFSKYQTPEHLLALKDKISKLESEITKKRAQRKEGYIDPKTKRFIKASENEMSTIMRTHDSEAVRKACFDALEKLAETCLDEYIQLVGLLNIYAKGLGYEDFYAYKLQAEEGMTKKELFGLFDRIYKKTKYGFKNYRKMEKKMPGLRKSWNTGYMLSGDFVKEEDPYFQFDQALNYWGRSFTAMGIDFQKARLKLDLLDREGKYSNGFCHAPELPRYIKGKRIPGSTNFTCNVVLGQVGSGSIGITTLFHEGGHAADFSNRNQKEVVLNHEFPPSSTAWAETQSMFLDSVFESIEWVMRYARNKQGQKYPFELYRKQVEKLHPIMPLNLMGIMFVAGFEKEIYEAKNLTPAKVKNIARKAHRKFTDKSNDSLRILNVPHIYAWESLCSYHGYGLAELSLEQWRQYFYRKYGYIVDNPKVGREMAKVWQLGASRTYKELVKLATGKKLSVDAYLEKITASIDDVFAKAQRRIARLEKVPRHKGKVNLNAHITMVHGKKEICNNSKGFEDMAKKYKSWLDKQLMLK